MLVAEVVAACATDPTAGLTSEEAARRLLEYGPNELAPAPTVPRWRRILAHFEGPVIYLLLTAIVISAIAWVIEGASGLPVDAMAIAVIVGVNGFIGYLQERRAEEAMAALRALTVTEAAVVRNGATVRVPAAEIVPGDVVVLTEGDLVPADGRLVEANALRIAEAALTGESSPVTKSTEAVAVGAPLGDRFGMAYGGTAVVSGRARAAITATGQETEVGRIATLLGELESEPTPLEQEIDRIGRFLGVSVLLIAAVVVATLLAVERPESAAESVDALLIGVSLAVAAVPEGLPAVLSVVLALGVQRLSKRNALVKRMTSIETLGSATVICSDKTGTLTRNEMTVRRLVLPSAEIEISGSGYGPTGDLLLDGADLGDDAAILDEARRALIVAGLASDASVDDQGGGYRAVGDPTEAALVAAQPKAGIEPGALGRKFIRVAELPFSPERKRMSTIQRSASAERLVMAVKGAPDVVLERCWAERKRGQVVPLDAERRRRWLDAIDDLTGQALRTLAVAYRPVLASEPENGLDESAENELVLLGVFGIIDPPRDEARQAIQMAHRAGIRVVMITGDHPSTASSIAIDLGIACPDDAVTTASDLDGATDHQLASMAASTSVYARVAPVHKLRIVKALNDRGEIVAMTGDGVNDAPALKAADIGIAMGITGSEVSKDAADMILADDNFATIVAAVSEGRAIFHNIRSFLRYLLSSNVGEVLTVFGGVVAANWIGLSGTSDGGLTSPLLAAQILWINLVTDAGPALALGVDPPRSRLMDRPPRRPQDRIIDARMQIGIGLIGMTMAGVTLAMVDLRLPGGFFAADGDLAEARTSAFTVLVLAQLLNTFNARSDTESAWGQLLANRWLLAAVSLSLGLQIAVVYLPFLQELFGTVSLGADDWLLALGLASSVIWVSEGRKLVLRRRR